MKSPVLQGMVSRRTANLVALVVFLILLLIGIELIIAVGPTFDPPTKTTTVLEVGKGEGTGKRTSSFEKEGRSQKKAGKRISSVEKPTAGGSTKRTRTVEEGSRTFLERSFGKSGLIGLQVAVVLLASFLAAALTQRALLGDFSIKVGSLLELSALQEAVAKPAADITANVTTLEATVREATKNQEALTNLVTANTADMAATVRAVVALEKRVATVERAVAKAARRRRPEERAK
jgi:hypothetical protein